LGYPHNPTDQVHQTRPPTGENSCGSTDRRRPRRHHLSTAKGMTSGLKWVKLALAYVAAKSVDFSAGRVEWGCRDGLHRCLNRCLYRGYGRGACPCLASGGMLLARSTGKSRSSNRTGRSPASGSRTRPHAFAHGWSQPSAVRRTISNLTDQSS
jgi:hypothetical protein